MDYGLKRIIAGDGHSNIQGQVSQDYFERTGLFARDNFRQLGKHATFVVLASISVHLNSRLDQDRSFI